jgi:RNA polymerase primary sigma factor
MTGAGSEMVRPGRPKSLIVLQKTAFTVLKSEELARISRINGTSGKFRRLLEDDEESFLFKSRKKLGARFEEIRTELKDQFLIGEGKLNGRLLSQKLGSLLEQIKEGKSKEVVFARGELRFLQRTEGLITDTVVRTNQGLIGTIVGKAKKRRLESLAHEDLMQEGNIGMLIAVEKFDPERGFRFSTYASWWIRSQLQRAIADTDRPIRLPVHMCDTLARIHKFMSGYSSSGGNTPGIDEISAGTGVPAKKVSLLLCIAGVVANSKDNGDEELQLLNIIPDRSSVNAEDAISDDEVRRILELLMDKLDARERLILKRRFGIGDGDTETLAEIGDDMSLSRERIRQIQSKALDELEELARIFELG